MGDSGVDEGLKDGPLMGFDGRLAERDVPFPFDHFFFCFFPPEDAAGACSNHDQHSISQFCLHHCSPPLPPTMPRASARIVVIVQPTSQVDEQTVGARS